MARFVRVLFILALTWGSLASQLVLPTSAAAAEIRLRTTQLQQILDAEKTDRANQTQKPSQAEIDAVKLRLTELRAIDADTVEGQAQLKNVLADKNALAYLRREAFYRLAYAESRQLKQIDAATAEGQAALSQVLLDAEALSDFRQIALQQLSNVQIRSAAVQQVALQFIRQDIHKDVCRQAIYSLPALGVPADVAVPVLIPMLDDHRNTSCRDLLSGQISYAAAEVLGRYGAAAADAIPRLAWDIDPANNRWSDREIARNALGQIAPDLYPFFVQGAAAIQPLIRQLSSPIQGRRLRAAERLLELHELAAPAAAALETALHDENRNVRVTAAAALLATKPHQEASSVLEQLAASEDSADRARLVWWLDIYQLNFDDEEILRGLLNDPTPQVRSAAATRLAKTDRHVAEAFDAMAALYKKGGSENQLPALNALSSFPRDQLRTEKSIVEDALNQPGSGGRAAKHLQDNPAPAGTNDAPAK